MIDHEYIKYKIRRGLFGPEIQVLSFSKNKGIIYLIFKQLITVDEEKI